MYFFADFKAASRDILGEVGQEAALEDAEKGAKSELVALRDRLILSTYTQMANIIPADDDTAIALCP